MEILSKRPYKGILGVSTDIKAVESGGNQFVFRVDVDEYYPFPSRYIRYMAVRPLAQPPSWSTPKAGQFRREFSLAGRGGGEFLSTCPRDLSV